MKNLIVMFKERLFEKNEDGFSLLELVVAIGILLVLTVGGLIGYSKITDNSRQAAVEKAASEVMTAAMVYDANGDNIQDPEHNPAKKWNDSASDDSVEAEMTITNSADGRCITVKARHDKGEEATRSQCVSNDEENTGGSEIVNIAAPSLTSECIARPGMLGLGSRVRINWKVADGYSLDDTQFLASTSGLGSPLAAIDGFNLSGNTTHQGDGVYQTDIPTNMLGGLLGLGSEIEIALRTVDGENYSEKVSVATNAGLLAGIDFSCRNL